MKYLLEVAKAVAEGVSRGETKKTLQAQKTAIDEEIAGLTNEDVSLLVETVFGAEPRIDGGFYEALTDFQHCIGYGPAYYALAARIWACAFGKLSRDKALELLSSLLGGGRRGFWTGIRCLPTFCTLVELPTLFVAKWFHDLGTGVAGDLAGGDFYDAICKYAETFPESAMTIFEQYVSQDLDPLRIHLAGLLLGTARAKSKLGKANLPSVRKWDGRLQKSALVQQRLIYDKSLVSSFNLGTLSISQLRAKLAKMLEGVPEEVSEAFDVVGRCLRKDRSDRKFIQFALEWYRRNSSPRLPDFAKYHLVESLWLFCSFKDVADRDSVISHANDLLIAIQPIPREHHGTWQELERYLVSILEFNRSEFHDVFARLIKANPGGVLGQIKGSGFLKGEIARANCEELVTGLLLSAEIDEWEIGKSLFADSEVNELSDDVLGKGGEIGLEIALLQFVRSPFLGKGTSKYLSELEPHFRNTSAELQKAFKNELTVQAMNYPEACLQAWKTRRTESPLMAEAVEYAERYFRDVSRLRDCPAISFSFPGCSTAGQKAEQVFRGKVMRQAKEKSVFAQFARHFELVYGDRWATFIGGKLSGPSSFSEHSHWMEFPRLEVIDPEGMAIRRLTASLRIQELKAGVK